MTVINISVFLHGVNQVDHVIDERETENTENNKKKKSSFVNFQLTCVFVKIKTTNELKNIYKKETVMSYGKMFFVTFTIIVTTFNISLQNQFIITSCHPYLNHHK